MFLGLFIKRNEITLFKLNGDNRINNCFVLFSELALRRHLELLMKYISVDNVRRSSVQEGGGRVVLNYLGKLRR